MTQVEIEKLILENGFKLESKEGHTTYEFGTGDIYRISQLIFKKMDYIPCCTELKDKENLTFREWKKANKYKRTMHGYYKQGDNLVKSMDVVLMYKDYQDSL